MKLIEFDSRLISISHIKLTPTGLQWTDNISYSWNIRLITNAIDLHVGVKGLLFYVTRYLLHKYYHCFCQTLCHFVTKCKLYHCWHICGSYKWGMMPKSATHFLCNTCTPPNDSPMSHDLHWPVIGQGSVVTLVMQSNLCRVLCWHWNGSSNSLSV